MTDEWRTVRIWFKKGGRAKYISHLDLNRCMTRALQMAKIPLWFTEGFHPHAFLTFALPLSLGISGDNEAMDIRLVDEISTDEIVTRGNKCLPEGIELFACTDPVMKPGKIAYGQYSIALEPENTTIDELENSFDSLLSMNEIIVAKKTKSGIKDIDIKPFINVTEKSINGDKLNIKLILPAGSTQNINPYLLINALQDKMNISTFASIIRNNLYNAEMELFR